MPTPPISVLMAVHNGARYVDDAMRGVLTQSSSDFEFLIVDDGSTDDSRAILKRWAAGDARIVLIEHDANQGLTRSLNRALAQARGAVVARQDADDMSLPDRLARQAAYLEAHPECAAVGTGLLSVDPEGAPLFRERRETEHECILANILKGRGGLAHPTVMFRRDAVRSVGGYDERYEVAQDIDLWLRLSERGCLANLPDVLVHYRRHFEAASVAKYERQVRNATRAITAYYERRGEALPRGQIMPYPRPLNRAETHAYWSARACYDGFTRSARKHAVLALKAQPSVAGVKTLLRAWLYSMHVKRGGMFS